MFLPAIRGFCRNFAQTKARLSPGTLYLMEWLAYPAAIIMGILLGLLGGGGSVLTLPILVYLLHIPTGMATTYSMFVVGVSACAGAVNYIIKKEVSWRAVLVFGIPSVLSIYFARKIVFPALPSIIKILGWPVSKDTLLMMIFAAFMLLASWSMIRKRKSGMPSEPGEAKVQDARYILLLLEGIAVGMIVGLIGAGGGFLIIPALVILMQLPMKKAVGTSLTLIFINSLLGFLSDLQNAVVIDWKMLLIFTGFAFAGIVGGTLLSRKIEGERLRPLFGWFILAMGLLIITEELILK
ncbi:MAG: hypothetical protein FD123_798 [Bacteroidetes bacterium]|nr:MAG: hypothetical protein FD123_798 [Bacteroidota bacterium]